MNEEKQIEEMAEVIKCRATNSLQCPRTTCAICKATEMYNAGYRKQNEGEWLSAYDYALKLGITDEKRLSDIKEDKWWKFCNKCEQAVKGFHNYCPNCGAKMKGGAV